MMALADLLFITDVIIEPPPRSTHALILLSIGVTAFLALTDKFGEEWIGASIALATAVVTLAIGVLRRKGSSK